ncbi:MAG: hypothetical protein ACKVVT_10265 [Dehalococcoidia bacterium]
MTYWAQILHFYQPPTQTHAVLRKVATESYLPLVGVLEEHPHARLAINIQGVLLDLLVEHGLGEVVERLGALVAMGQVELLGSGEYHPILPLVSEPLRARSIAGHAAALKRHLGASGGPGFFPPELCFDAGLAPAIGRAGHGWVLLSGVACPDGWPTATVYRVATPGHELAALFRDDVRSNRISFRETDPTRFIADLSGLGSRGQAYVVTAMDGETYGHHIRGWERDFLATTYDILNPERAGIPAASAPVIMVQPSELLDLFPAGPAVTPRAASWSTTESDIAAGDPYPLWRSPGNEVHAMQWDYVDHVVALHGAALCFAATSDGAKKYAAIADETLDAALHSCQFWWASRRPMWDVTMIHRGFQLLTTVLLNAEKSVALAAIPNAERRETEWRAAAAADLRQRLERILFVESPA